ncbi:hypothetical protein NDU88_003255 [Pleurodeles waltl]|uniref:Uncharacterized protein n=1 Tax=Pleurodeles waltl TaxID=8319 RepID=A0AAV7SFE8_PLEWA|nr:hypothetical protein NDU88_003255 [Pleurodeles waltl]
MLCLFGSRLRRRGGESSLNICDRALRGSSVTWRHVGGLPLGPIGWGRPLVVSAAASRSRALCLWPHSTRCPAPCKLKPEACAAAGSAAVGEAWVAPRRICCEACATWCGLIPVAGKTGAREEWWRIVPANREPEQLVVPRLVAYRRWCCGLSGLTGAVASPGHAIDGRFGAPDEGNQQTLWGGGASRPSAYSEPTRGVWRPGGDLKCRGQEPVCVGP